jgi:competence protein ComEC
VSATSRALDAVRAHSRHLVLAGLVAGLVTGPLSPLAAVLVAALVATLAGRPAPALLAAAAVLAGALGADARLAALDRSGLSGVMGPPRRFSATLLEPGRPSSSGGRSAPIRLEHGPGAGERVLLRAGRRTRWPVAAVGAELAVRGRLAPLGPHDAYQRRRGAHAVLVAFAVRATSRRRAGLAGALDAARGRAERGVAGGLDPPLGALARGMVLGEDDRLAEPVREDFRRTGLSHLLAASGQNVMLLAALALPLLAALGVALRPRLVVVLGLIALYVPLAGAGPSIQRAGVMGAAGIAAALAGRPSSRWYALLLAAAVTLALDPRADGDPGWQLSFAAVLAILVLGARVRAWLIDRRAPGAAADAAALTFAATLGTLPLLAFHFERVSIVSLPANLLAAPAVAPIMWLGMLAATAGQVAPPAAVLINAVNQFPLAYLEWLAHDAAAVPGAAVPARLPSALAVAGAYAALALVVAVPALRAPAAAVAVVAAVGAALGSARGPPGPDPRVLTVSFLDIGQGDATLVQHHGATVLIDTGPPGGPLLRRLRSAGVRRVDLLVVTHAQADHEGEAAAVLRRYPVGLLLDGGAGAPTAEHRALVAAAARERVRRIAPDAGQTLRAGPLELRVLWPHLEPAALHAGEDPNQRAVVADLRDGGFHLFLPADAESDVTATLDLPQVDALKVAHHGSADPGLAAELARLRPRIAVIEVGRHNGYGHPTAQALRALRPVPTVLRTDRDGTVRLTLTRGGLAVAAHS